MALFKSAEEKKENLLEKYGLANISDPQDLASLQKIAQELTGSGLMEAGMKLSMARPVDQLPISLQRAIMEQNFIMIRQLDRITELLKQR